MPKKKNHEENIQKEINQKRNTEDSCMHSEICKYTSTELKYSSCLIKAFLTEWQLVKDQLFIQDKHCLQINFTLILGFHPTISLPRYFKHVYLLQHCRK